MKWVQFLVWLTLMVGLPASAGGTAEAKKHFLRGEALYKQGQYEGAIQEFQAAYATRPHPVVLYNLGQCYEKLGDAANALKSYQDYLRQMPDAPDHTRVETVIANLTKRLKETAVQPLNIDSVPSGASVVVDNEPVGKTPLKLQVKGSTHHLAFILPGYDTLEQDVETSWERPLDLTVSLQEHAVGAAPNLSSGVSLGPAVPQGGNATPPGASGVSVSAQPASGPHRVWTWVAGGVGVAAITAGVIEGLSERSTQSQLGPLRTGAANQSIVNSAQSKATVANVLYGVGGVAVAAATVLFFFEGKF
jgi:hypothetical protein